MEARGNVLVRLDRLELDGRVVVRGSARRTAVVQILLDVVIAEATDLWLQGLLARPARVRGEWKGVGGRT